MTVSFEVDGQRVLLDEADLLTVAGLRWRLNRSDSGGGVYARAYPKHGVSVTMHRLILNAPPGVQVDHKNGNGLDNRRVNLRLCSHQQNQWNAGRRRNNTSGFVGVVWNTSNRRWEASYRHEGRRVYVGLFDTPAEASAARLAALAPIRGEFLRTA